MSELRTESSTRLLERARNGDHEALDELLSRYLPRLRLWARGRLPARARGLLDTDDLVQDTVIRTLRNLDHLEIRGEGALQAYLRQALSNRLTDEFRRTLRRPAESEMGSDIEAGSPSPLEEAIGEEALRRYDGGLQRLRAEDRQAVILRIELCYEYGEIAEMLGKPSAGAARVAVSRALARLSHEMRDA
jgi:RNA polymerase sigma-70 factor (ECF subfamily)